MNDIQKILDATNFMYTSQGYADINLIAKISGIPELIVVNILLRNGYKKSGIPTQFIKK